MIPKEEPFIRSYDPMPYANEIKEFEERLASDPWNLDLRAGLMSRYQISKTKYDGFIESLVNHILWFIEQAPDWKFCGEMHFNLRPTDFGFAAVRDAWELKIEESDNLMRRVNCYLFHYSYEQRFLPGLYERLFKGREDDIWVRALAQMDESKQTLFSDLIEIERSRPFPSLNAMKKFQAFDDVEIVRQAIAEFGSIKNYDRLKMNFDTRTSPKKLSELIGCIWNRYPHMSNLGLDPDILETYIKLSAWFIRNKPRISRESYYVVFSPFYEGNRYGSIEIQPAITLLTDLWLEQVDRFPDDLRIARNAVKLCRRIHISSPEDHKRIMKQVGKTPVGKRALRLERY